jgi:hypothetical protein
VARVTRVVTVLAVAVQATLLGLEVVWAVRAGGAVGAAVRAQGALLAATVVLALLAFRSAARIPPTDPLLRLRRSGGLRLAAIRVPLTGGRR